MTDNIFFDHEIDYMIGRFPNNQTVWKTYVGRDYEIWPHADERCIITGGGWKEQRGDLFVSDPDREVSQGDDGVRYVWFND